MGKIIAGTYEIDRKIGSGGGGVVYLGRHLRLQKLIVLKADKRKLTTDKTKLRREVDLLKGLTQTYIPQVYDFVEDDGTVYTVMDYIEGESLDKMLKRGEKPAQKDVIRWACELLEALSYLHSRPPHGILHGDIKPANIMLRPDGTICLIDFNIALALGEDGAVSVGYSRGYASPESYGYVYMSAKRAAAFIANNKTETTKLPILETDESVIQESQKSGVASSETTVLADDAVTKTADDAVTGLGDDAVTKTEGDVTEPARETPTGASSSSGTGTHPKVIRLDVRSDIYSLGATLYHLLSGRRPVMVQPGNQVPPLTAKDCSPAVAAIINRAMAPSAEDRYQSADEMLAAFHALRENDPRTRKIVRTRRVGIGVSIALFLLGGAVTFTGMQQLQQRQEALTLAEYSTNALADGDVDSAIQNALLALPEGGIFDAQPTAEAHYALTNALGVYDLSDHYKDNGVVTLSSEPFHMVKSPEGTRFAAVTGYEATVYDFATGKKLFSMPTAQSALADAVFADEDTLIFAGEDGVTACRISTGEVLWTGKEATTLSVSADGTRVAALNRDDTQALLYDTATGEVLSTVDFEGRKQRVASNDTYEDPDDDIFALNHDGSYLAVSFDGGALLLFDTADPEGNIILYDTGENDYNHFEGGFCGQYFSYVAYNRTNNSGSEYVSVDLDALEMVAGYTSNDMLHLRADESGTYLVEGGLLNLVDLDNASMEELANVQNSTIHAFDVSGDTALVTTEDGRSELYQSTVLEDSVTREVPGDFVLLTDSAALMADKNSPETRLMAFQSRSEDEILAYDSSIPHDEARISADGKTAMLFDIDGFTLMSMEDGSKIAEVSLPDPDNIYDQQYRRGEEGSYLEVFWYDGTVRQYSAVDGSVLLEKQEEAKSKDLKETFEVGDYQVVSRLHEAPEVLDAKTGEHVTDLESEGALTYVSAFQDMFVTEYISEDGLRYGYLLNKNFEKLAYLPDLCDLTEDGFVFDTGTGSLRYQDYLTLDELKARGEEALAE